METTERQRLAQFVEYLGVSTKTFEESCGLYNGYVKGKRTKRLGEEGIAKILGKYPNLNKVWLLTGDGEMLTKSPADIPGVMRASELDAAPMEHPTSVTRLSSIPGMLPETSFKFAAGQTELVNERESVNRYWYLPDCTDCEAVAPVSGQSMQPALPAGCYVALKRFNALRENPNSIPFGEIFGVVVEDECTGERHGYIKVIRKHKEPELAKNYWIAHSINPEYDDFDIAINQVCSLWIVKQHIVTDFNY